MTSRQVNNLYKEIFFVSVSVLAGAVVIYVGDTLVGVQLEVIKVPGYLLSYFTPMLMVDMFIVPLIGGFVVTSIYGLGGKILSGFAPVLVRGYCYYSLTFITPPGEGETLPFLYWILPVIITVEVAWVGGFLGEVMIKKIYGRPNKKPNYITQAEKAELLAGKEGKNTAPELKDNKP